MKFADFDKKIIKDNVKYSVDKITEIIPNCQLKP